MPAHHEFCAQFDRHYLTRAVVLYRSLERHCQSFRFHAYCMDEESERALRALDFPHLTVVPLAQLEADDPELAAVKETRSHTEYVWTVGPSICLHVLDRDPEVETITRLDADVEFMSDPTPLLAELGEGSVLLSPDRWSAEFRASRRGRWYEWFGRFAAECETFRRDAAGLAALRWWRERCIEWCYDRPEVNRYADQKYLDELPQRFPGVRESQHLGGGLAARNVQQFELERLNGRLYVDGVPAIFHHFQSLEIHPATATARRLARTTRAYRLADGPMPLVWTTGWRPREEELALLWEPYVHRLSEAVAEVRAVAGEIAAPVPELRAPRAGFHILRRRLPDPIRTFYWYARAVAWRRVSRGARAEARQESHGVARPAD